MRVCLQVYPNLVKEFNFNKNYPLTPQRLTKFSSKKVWWICSRGHEWIARISSRTYGKGKGCPYCSGRKVTPTNSLNFLMPDLSKEWDSIKNINLKSDNVSKYSNKKVWWICSKGHSYVATIASRSNGSGCPYCANRFASKENNLNILYPNIAKEWHPTKNLNLTPSDVTKSSGKKVWWLCLYGHEWITAISVRTKKITRCPYCVNHPSIYKRKNKTIVN